MRWLGPVLLVGVFIRHNTSFWLPIFSAPEWFYILGGLWETVLCVALLLLLKNPLAIAALWIGVMEGSQVTVCGALMGHRRAPAGMNDCDYLLGWPLGATMTALYLGIICWAIGKAWRKG
jgi:hypothetical protein